MSKPVYTRTKSWIQEYGDSGAEDQRAIDDFMTIESAEAVTSLRNELISISQEKYDEESLDKLIGIKRKVKYGSHHDWAKLMLMWIAAYKG